uniref:Uncharacterized protein n=1 Tax=Opuntia streptacantha TaxID=393608 RepID=A0A7C8YJA8_OPUST
MASAIKLPPAKKLRNVPSELSDFFSSFGSEKKLWVKLDKLFTMSCTVSLISFMKPLKPSDCLGSTASEDPIELLGDSWASNSAQFLSEPRNSTKSGFCIMAFHTIGSQAIEATTV